MSARPRRSDASDGSQDARTADDRLLDASLDELQAEEQQEQAALARELARGGFLGDFGADSSQEMDAEDAEERDSSPHDPHAGAGAGARGGARSNAARMLEALEALSQEAEGFEGGAGVPQSLRGLLEQLNSSGGADNAMLGGMFPFSQLLQAPSAGSPRFRRMLESLSAESPPHVQMSGLSDLCETLSMSTEEVLAASGFSVDAFVPAVVTLLRFPSSMDVLLLAARALSSILELFPSAAIPKAIAENVIPSLCEKLLEIEYLDVAELALQILERIICKAEAAASAEYRVVVIQEHGLVALLQFVDFFPLEIQRRAARIFCQLCTDFPLELADRLQQALPYLTNLLHLQDAEILQCSCDALHKLGESVAFSENPEFAALVASDEVCNLLLHKLGRYAGSDTTSDLAPDTPLSPTGYANILRFLSSLLSCVGSEVAASSVAQSASQLRFVRLPPLLTALLAKQEVVTENQLLRETLKLVVVVLPIAEELEPDSNVPAPMLTLAHEILPLIVHVYEMTSRADLRFDCLGVLSRSCSLGYAIGQPFTARERAEMSGLTAFLARVLRPKGAGAGPAKSSAASSRTAELTREKELLPVLLALRVVEVPLQHEKAREAVKELFERHGVASAIRFYASCPKIETEEEGGDLYEVRTTSARLVDLYLGTEKSEASVVGRLQVLAADLQTAVAAVSAGDNQEQSASLDEVLLQLQQLVEQGEEFMTAHEIACSGLVKALIALLSVDEGKQAFSRVILEQATPDSSNADAGFVASLLQCLQDAISSEKDAFSVDGGASVSSTSFSFDSTLSSGSVANDLDQLTQHIKVRVLIEEEKVKEMQTEDVDVDVDAQHAEGQEDQEEADSEQSPLRWMKKTASLRLGGGSYRSNKRSVHDTVVLVEPLARIETMEDFIADKLFGSSANTSSLLDELAGDAASDEDEEGENEPEAGDFANDKVKLRRVEAVYKGHVLHADMSIVEAIVKFGGEKTSEETGIEPAASAAGSPVAPRSRIWGSSPHEITFRVVASPHTSTPTVDSASSVESAQCVAEAEHKDAGEWWDDVWDLLLLLRLVRERTAGRPAGQKLHFVNSFLSLQVTRALQQPVRVVAKALPRWCFRLVHEFGFVLDFETRYHFMYATTCGSSRAIQYLCRSVWKKAVAEEPAAALSSRRTTASSRRRHRDGGSRSRTSGLVNISRMAKLPRLKVRVARARLLQSAMKLLAIYGGKKAVIEIEFLGEVGTGLGPTTEFFTLVCQEIQAKKLQLWRDDDRARSDVSDLETKREEDDAAARALETQSDLPVRGYHRVAVYHCPHCKALHVPTCSLHEELLTHEKRTSEDTQKDKPSSTGASVRRKPAKHAIPQCAQCLDAQDWHSDAATCSCTTATYAPKGQANDEKPADKSTLSSTACSLKWWILSDEEVAYLAKVYPRQAAQVTHPVLQCAHCDTVNFPGTDAGIVVMEGERMVSRSGRRMFERDYRAVTKHVSPLCEGTPLAVLTSVLTRDDVDLLVARLPRSPEVLESEVDSLNYLSQVASDSRLGGGPAVTAPFGLFPKPFVASEAQLAVLEEAKPAQRTSETSSSDVETPEDAEVDVLTWFTFLGRFVAQALLDERLLNLPFARPFLRALRGEVLVGEGVSMETSLGFVDELDPALATSLRYLHSLAFKYAAAVAEDALEMPSVATWRAEVDAMALSFTLLGQEDVPLCPGGADTSVTLATLDEYLCRTLSVLLRESISSQVTAFQCGFQDICGVSSRGANMFLTSFDVHELETLLSDRGAGSSMWSRDGQELRDHLVCAHGYTLASGAIADLVAILCELPVDEQRLFVRFVTGANRLPVGGLARLEPKLTVVRKMTPRGDAQAGEDSDAVLPSASTCTNYLKLPEYSSREVMRQRLRYCIHEGQCSFHLS